MIFYLTFGQDHPLIDGWIEVRASDYMEARRKILETFDTKWSSLYGAEFQRKYFPAGKFGNTLE